VRRSLSKAEAGGARWADWIVRTGLCGLVAAVPLLYSGWVTVYAKWLVLDLGVAGLLAIRAWQWAQGVRPFPRNARLLAPLAAFAAASALASLGASNPWLALIALYRLVHAAALYLLVVDLAGERRDDGGLLWTMLLAGGVACLIGMSQFLVPGSFEAWGARRRFIATSGNTNYAGGYLLTLLGPTIALSLVGRSRMQRCVAGGLVVLQGMSLLLTNALGAWASVILAGGAVALALAWAGRRGVIRSSAAAPAGPPPPPAPRPAPRRRWVRAGVLLAGALMVLAAGAVLLRAREHALGGREYSFVGRLAALRNLSDTSLYSRSSVFRDTLGMIADRPVLGVGAGQFVIEFLPYSRLADEPVLRAALVEHPHNEYLDIVAESGLLGLAAFVWLAWRVAGMLRDACLRSRREALLPLAAGLAGSVAGVGAYGAFMYPFHLADTLTNTLVTLGLAEGLWSGRGEPASPRRDSSPGAGASRARRWPGLRLAAVGSLVCFEAVAWTTLSFRPTLAEGLFRLGAIALSQRNLPVAASAFEGSATWFPAKYESVYEAGAARFDVGDYAGTLAWAKRSLAAHRNLLPAFDIQGGAHLARGEKGEAAAVFKRALAVNPIYTTALNNLGGLYLEQGRWPEARRLFARAIAAYPTRTHAHLNLALLEWRSGHLAEALDLYKRVTQLDPSSAAAWYSLASLGAALGRTEEAMAALSTAVATDRTLAWRAAGDKNFDALKAATRFREIVGAAQP
jgi:tetratricopeptide (TPR) repeat protein